MMDYYLFNQISDLTSPVCGCAMLNPGWRHMRRCFKNENVLIFGRKGTAKIYVGQSCLQVKPGRMLLLPAGIEHYGKEAAEKPLSYYWVHFVLKEPPTFMEENEAMTFLTSPAVAYQRLQDSLILPLELDVSNPKSFENILNTSLQEFQKPGFSSLIYKNLVEKLLLEASGECFKNPDVDKNLTGSRVLVQKVFVLLESELSNPNASIKFFAAKLGVNANYLGRVFKEAMHVSLSSYLSARRIDIACIRLRESKDTIDCIAKQCGFGSRRQFYQEFKNFKGLTPASYRSQSSFIGINSL